MTNLFVISTEILEHKYYYDDIRIEFKLSNGWYVSIPITELPFYGLSTQELYTLAIADDGQTVYVNKGIITRSVNIMSLLKKVLSSE